MKKEDLKNEIMNLIVKVRVEGYFNSDLYLEIYENLSDLVYDWKRGENIPKEYFVLCLNLMNFLAGGQTYLKEEDRENMNNAHIELYELFMTME